MIFLSILFNVCFNLLYYEHTNTKINLTRFVVSLTPGASISGSIGIKDLSQKRTRGKINDVDKGC